MKTNSLLHRIQTYFVYRTLSSDIFFHPLYMKAFRMLHRMTLEEKRDYQFYRLRHLLRYAHYAIPYWGKLIKKDLTDSSPFDIKKFERLPILTRETLIKHGDECVVRNLKRHKYRTFVTSGSTGIPKRFVANKTYFQKFVATDEFYVNFLGVDFRQFGWMTHKPHLADLVTYIPITAGTEEIQRLLENKSITAAGGSLHRLLSLAEKVEAGKVRFKPKFILSGSEFLTRENK